MPKHSNFAKGVFFAFISYLMWGLFPLYWKQLSTINASVLLCHRVVWSFVFLMIFIPFSKKVNVRKLITKKNVAWLALTGVLIGTNWGVYIYAVNTKQIVASSFGYYINPLMNIALGVLLLKEKLSNLQKVALLFALLGVTIMAIHIGGIPIISLILALTFALYGFFKKILNMESIAALTIETAVLFPIAAFWIFHSYQASPSAVNYLSPVSLLLMLGGVLTAVPLIWFGRATTLIPLSTIGFIQYISPTSQLLIAVLVYKESFSNFHLVSFGLVWVGLLIYSYGMYKEMKVKREK